MAISRRNFLKFAGGLGAAAALPSLSFTMKANAAPVPVAKKLIVLTLNGGCDGLNLCIPTDPDQFTLYQGYRTRIGIPQANVIPFGTDWGNRQFGLHPAMSSIMAYQDKLALFPATHTGSLSNRSHFVQEDLIDDGLYTGISGNNDGKGWLGRAIETKHPLQPEGVIMQDFSPGHSHFMAGNTFVLAVSNPSNISNLGVSTSDTIWADVHRIQDPDASGYAGMYAHQQEQLFAVIDRVKTSVNFNRVVTSGIAYPANSTHGSAYAYLGTNFKRAADMLLTLPELESLHIMQDGYDTHKSQGSVTGHQERLFRAMSDALVALYADLGAVNPALRDNVVVVVKTEFGRTVRDNADGGTDHGQASCWMAFGGSVIGGVYGNYPGLEPANLEGNNWLKPTIDYRDILSELLGPKFLGLSQTNANASFPGYQEPATRLNFLY